MNIENYKLPDIGSYIHANELLKNNVFKDYEKKPNKIPFWYREPGLWLPLSCAIALDTSLDNFGTTGTSLTQAYTVTGLRPYLVAPFYSGTFDAITGVTYAGIAMTKITSLQPTGVAFWLSMWVLANPATGSNNLIASASGSVVLLGAVSSYTGVQQSSTPDASSSVNGTTVQNLVQSVTTVADNCWTVACTLRQGGSQTGWTNATGRAPNMAGTGLGLGDSNAAITPAGSYSITANSGGAGNQWAGIMISIAPFTLSGSMFLVF